MSRGILSATLALAIALGAAPLMGSASASSLAPAATKPFRYSSCAKLHVRFPHGVGKPGAVDHSAASRRTTTFTRNKAWYTANKGLDRDHDGIACEKK